MDRESILPQLEALHADAYGWAVSCCAGDPHRGADVLQAAYVKALRGEARFEGRSVVRSWWFGVIRFTALEEGRRLGRWLAFLDRWRREPAEAETGPVAAPEDGRLAALQIALPRLPARQREVLHLVFYQGTSLSEAAEVMGVSVGSARQHYARGKDRLREWLGAEGGGDE